MSAGLLLPMIPMRVLKIQMEALNIAKLDGCGAKVDKAAHTYDAQKARICQKFERVIDKTKGHRPLGAREIPK